MKPAGKKVLTFSQVLKKAADYCAIQEHCQQDIRNKALEWGLSAEEAEQCIAELIGLGFINEERYAKAFAAGKFSTKKWGRIKIKNELKKKKISEYCINKGLQEIDERYYSQVLNEILRKKAKEVKDRNHYKKMNKIAAYALQKGYEPDMVWDAIREMFVN